MEQEISVFHPTLLLLSLWARRECDLCSIFRQQDESQGMSYNDGRKLTLATPQIVHVVLRSLAATKY